MTMRKEPHPASGFARVVAPTLEDERPPLRRMPHAALLGLLVAAWFGGVFERLELALADLRFAAVERQASGELVLIEAGQEQLSSARLAAALDRLLAAGVRQVAFADEAPVGAPEFRAALARAGERVVLPAQGAAEGPTRRAALDLPADADGRTRSFPIWSEQADGEAIPTLPAALLGVRVAGAPAAPGLDFSIRAETLPRLAVQDVLAGADLDELAGRDVMVALLRPGEPMAATAQGPLPRAELLALAYETLAQQRWIVSSNPIEALAPAAALMLAFGPWFVRWSWRRGLVALVAWQAACLALSLHAQAAWAISLDVLPWLAAPLLSYAWETARRVREVQQSPVITLPLGLLK